MARKKSSEIAASASPSGVVVAGVELDGTERDARIQSFAARCARGKKQPKKERSKAAQKAADARMLLEIREDLPDTGPGRPRSFINDIHFEHACREYFAGRANVSCKEKRFNHGQWEEVEVERNLPVTILGLCQFLGITRVTFYRYLEGGHEFRSVAEWAQEKCELDLQERLFDKASHAGAKFMLSAKFDYAEKKKLNLSGGISDEEFLAALDDMMDVDDPDGA